MDLQLWLAVGYVSEDSGYIVNEYYDEVKRITIQSLPYVDNKNLDYYLNEYIGKDDEIYLYFRGIPIRSIGNVVDSLIDYYLDGGPDTWMEGDITLTNGKELSIGLIGITITTN